MTPCANGPRFGIVCGVHPSISTVNGFLLHSSVRRHTKQCIRYSFRLTLNVYTLCARLCVMCVRNHGHNKYCARNGDSLLIMCIYIFSLLFNKSSKPTFITSSRPLEMQTNKIITIRGRVVYIYLKHIYVLIR